MKKPNKSFWQGLLVFVIIMGTLLGCTIYMALRERNKKEQFRQINQERIERIKRSIELSKHHNDSVRATMKLSAGEMKYEKTDDSRDPYDNPDFDDLIPGEEYDEEFVDRSQGDLELYETR